MPIGPYIGTTLEDDWFMTRPFTISKCAYCLSRLIRVRSKKIIKPFAPKLFKKPFAVENYLVKLSCTSARYGLTYMYGPGSSFNALKYKPVSSTSTGPLTYKRLVAGLKNY